MKKRPLSILGTAAALLVPILVAIGPGATPAQASSDPNFLKASGKYLRNDSGNGSIVNLRGTNLGGWLTMEDWMSPLGEFALDRTRWTAMTPPAGTLEQRRPAANGSRSTWDHRRSSTASTSMPLASPVMNPPGTRYWSPMMLRPGRT